MIFVVGGFCLFCFSVQKKNLVLSIQAIETSLKRRIKTHENSL